MYIICSAALQDDKSRRELIGENQKKDERGDTSCALYTPEGESGSTSRVISCIDHRHVLSFVYMQPYTSLRG